jgi:hypothetical protein
VKLSDGFYKYSSESLHKIIPFCATLENELQETGPVPCGIGQCVSRGKKFFRGVCAKVTYFVYQKVNAQVLI